MRKTHLLVAALVVITACHKKPKPTYPTYGTPQGQPSVVVWGTPTTQPTQTAPTTVPTQVSDADRASARDLYNAGVALQGANKPADALDKFQRSFAVFPAPTTALRQAQCKVALGRFVEGAEDYRAIMNTQIPASSPPAFFDAQKLAGDELKALDPRIPRITVMVTPDRIQGLQVMVDGHPINLALVGAPRPVDPGVHKVSASAPGYGTSEQSVEVKEKEQKDAKLTLAKK